MWANYGRRKQREGVSPIPGRCSKSQSLLRPPYNGEHCRTSPRRVVRRQNTCDARVTYNLFRTRQSANEVRPSVAYPLSYVFSKRDTAARPTASSKLLPGRRNPRFHGRHVRLFRLRFFGLSRRFPRASLLAAETSLLCIANASVNPVYRRCLRDARWIRTCQTWAWCSPVVHVECFANYSVIWLM